MQFSAGTVPYRMYLIRTKGFLRPNLADGKLPVQFDFKEWPATVV